MAGPLSLYTIVSHWGELFFGRPPSRARDGNILAGGMPSAHSNKLEIDGNEHLRESSAGGDMGCRGAGGGGQKYDVRSSLN